MGHKVFGLEFHSLGEGDHKSLKDLLNKKSYNVALPKAVIILENKLKLF